MLDLIVVLNDGETYTGLSGCSIRVVTDFEKLEADGEPNEENSEELFILSH